MLQPTAQCVQIDGTLVISHGRARKRKSLVVSAPTGQMSVVLPENLESKPGVGHRLDLHLAPALVETQHVIVGDLVLEADAARALNAALVVEEDQLAQRIVLVEVLLVGVIEARDAGAVMPASSFAAGTRRPCRRSGNRAGATSAEIPARPSARASPPHSSC